VIFADRIGVSDWQGGRLRRLIASVVVLASLAACRQDATYTSNTTRLDQSKWFIGVAVIGLLLAAWAAWSIRRDTRHRSGHRERRKRH
jgi:hypothetical protein